MTGPQPWPTGRTEVLAMVERGELEHVVANLDDVEFLLATAGRHLESALALADPDPEAAYAVLYDAARKSLVAVLLAQGLRPTSRGGHVAVQMAIGHQFTSPPPSAAFRPYGRLRRRRNESEYDRESVDADEVLQDHAAVLLLHQTAARLVPALGVLPRK